MEDVTEITFYQMASLLDAKAYFDDLPEQLADYLDADYKRALAQLMDTLNQFFNIVSTVNHQACEDKRITRAEATDIADHGFIILLKLSNLMEKLDLPHKRKEIEQISLIFARWVIRFNGSLNYLEPIVNALSESASAMKDKESLLALSNLMSLIVDACSDEIKYDLDNSQPYRPWRLLHINRCIVALRTHNLPLIKRAFDELLLFLPQDAADFFREGVQEMEDKNYPAHVRQLVQQYYQAPPKMSLH